MSKRKLNLCKVTTNNRQKYSLNRSTTVQSECMISLRKYLNGTHKPNLVIFFQNPSYNSTIHSYLEL